MTEPRRWWCNFDGYQLPGELSIPFKRVRCPNCRRYYTVEEVEGVVMIQVYGAKPAMVESRA